jgi:hypothetical protein
MDNHAIWRLVRANYESLSQASPDGYAPVVEVFLARRSEPVRLALVHTNRDPDFPWALLAAETKEDSAAPPPDARLIFVPEGYIERIEIYFAPVEDRRIGFSIRELNNSSAPEPEGPSGEPNA